MKNDNPWRPPTVKRPSPPSSAETESYTTDAKRSRSQFLSSEHHKLLRRYILNVAAVIAEREKRPAQTDYSDEAVDLIINSISNVIGNLWEVSVRLSKMKIDTTMDVLVGDILVDETKDTLDCLKRLDRQQRQRLASPSAANSGDEKAPAPAATPANGASGRATLFEAQPTLSGEQEEARRAKEAAIVNLKQAELTREVNVNYLTAALNMHVVGGAPLVAMPARARNMFTVACAFFYENFVERVLVNFIQQRQQKRPLA